MPSISSTPPSAFDREFNSRLDDINQLSLGCPEERPALMKQFFDLSGEEFDKGIIQRHSRYKPLGYAGDYLIIDWTYTQKADSPGVGAAWDQFYHRQDAPTAVRNRKEFFCSLYTEMCAEREGGISVLNLASGPCRDVAEAITRAGDRAAGSHFHCVDIEKDAISYAMLMVEPHTAVISFQWELSNIFKFQPVRQYDLVWSAGLFDYLEDKAAVSVLKRMWDCTSSGGKLLAGNFHPLNASRNYMEWGGNWFLRYRTEEDLLGLCARAGIPAEDTAIEQEALGACVFCVATRR
jgi:hypothetical protein